MRRDTSTMQADMITHQNLTLAGRNLGYEDLESPSMILAFDYFESMMTSLTLQQLYYPIKTLLKMQLYNLLPLQIRGSAESKIG